MRRRINWFGRFASLLSPLALLTVLAFPARAATPWSGILDPSRAIDWSTAGIPGGIPVRTETCAQIAASTCGNGNADCTATLQTALNSCPAGQVVLLGVGVFLLNNVLSIPGNVTLRGQGADQTILNIKSASGSGAITMGSWTVPWNMSGNLAITDGTEAGSKSITVADAGQITVGGYFLITELNDPTFVTIAGDEGSCTWCSPFNDNGARVLGQVSEVISVNGNKIGINPGLFRSMSNPLPNWSPNTRYPLNAFITPAAQPSRLYQQTFQNEAEPYTCMSGGIAPAFDVNGGSVSDGSCVWRDLGSPATTRPLADPFIATQYAGIENLQIYANNTGAGASIAMNQCAYCWVKGVEDNFADADHVDISLGYHDEIVDSYFSNAYSHMPGTSDSDIDIRSYTTGALIQNNIMERNHVSVMLEWGAAGNVVAYNYMFGNFDSRRLNPLYGSVDLHGAHAEFNLFEGNIADSVAPDGTWGSSSHNTIFRDWYRGTTKMCNFDFPGKTGSNAQEYWGGPINRSAVVCDPMGVAGDANVNGWWAVQQPWAAALGIYSSYYNFVGDILGSQDMAKLTIYNGGTPMQQIDRVVAACGPSPCGPGSRSYDAASAALSLGYWGADDGSSPYGTLTPYSTLILHGVFLSPSESITWAPSLTHALPASFYLSGKPAWFGSVPFPPIGPEIIGGLANAYGHAYPIPAKICYEQVMGGTDGTGSPLLFNAANCYGGGSSSPTQVDGGNPLASVRVYPNPWRADRHGRTARVVFDQLTSGNRVKIFTASGHLVRDLGRVDGRTSWDLKSDSGDTLASGVYLYLVTDDRGNQKRGKVAIIR